MELGVQGLNSLTRSDATLPLARLAEERGYRSWWAQDHVVLPTEAGSPVDPTTPVVDPLVHLAHVAAVTRRMTLGTAVIILPQRNPLVLAKQAASLDALSGGRFVLGVGAGAPAFHGRHAAFSGVDAHPRPTGLRVVVGGRSSAAYRRAVGRAHGFYGNGTPEEIAGDLDGLRRAAQEVHRPARLGPLEVTAMPLGPVDAASAQRYADLGVDRLVLRPEAGEPGVSGDTDRMARFLERHAHLGGR